MRSKLALTNIGVNFITQVIVAFLGFFSRAIFIGNLDITYLGINSLFTNIVGLLTLLELGVGAAFNYSLYKPLADKDHSKVKALMKLFKKLYTYVSLIIIIIGLSILPFLDIFVKEEIKYLEWYFILFILDAAISYLFSYKQTLLFADQKGYVISLINVIVNIFTTIIKIFVLIFTQNYFLYLLVMIFSRLVLNYWIFNKANKMYPEIENSEIVELTIQDKKQLTTNIKALFIDRISGFIITSTDNIIISAFIGLKIVGTYANYFLVTSTFNVLISKILTSITPSYGNLFEEKDTDKSYKIFNILQYISFLIYSSCALTIYLVINDFIAIWIGQEYVFSNNLVLVIIISFFVNGSRQYLMITRTAGGLYWADRYRLLAEAILNIILSLILVQYLGLMGVLLGTLFSIVIISFYVEPFLIYKYLFPNKNLKIYFIKTLYYYLVIFLQYNLLIKIREYFFIDGIFSLILVSGFLFICANLTFVVGTMFLNEFKLVCSYLKIFKFARKEK
ncbi:hypothetical protein [Planococcus sp. S3-L1]|uniref:lipopolysaccharide biosynthesis protein n=1 Tax=Planococcus sp. S3-L1 TaxID=3046200 RepID=UPI0024BB16A6|nr:hypothetical protein [Planococcus sp. S3-L1]MDJ0332961.1 hypothetical protein [Planococcus sp. S3-L1]